MQDSHGCGNAPVSGQGASIPKVYVALDRYNDCVERRWGIGQFVGAPRVASDGAGQGCAITVFAANCLFAVSALRVQNSPPASSSQHSWTSPSGRGWSPGKAAEVCSEARAAFGALDKFDALCGQRLHDATK